MNNIVKNETQIESVTADGKICQLEKGLSCVCFSEDYMFNEFLANGGAEADREVIEFLKSNLIGATYLKSLLGNIFGCSTVSVRSEDGYIFERNFDWESCNALVVEAYPENDYSSVSTVNTDFIRMSGLDPSLMPDNILTMAAIYAPLDGMNEKGLCVSVNMIQDSEIIEQNTDKPDITTTTAIRLLLDKAADTDEALALLEQYDMHASMGMVVHFAIADNTGNSVVVEYIGNEMIVTKTPAVTNFYISEGEKYGIGTAQFHERYDILMEFLSENDTADTDMVKNALDSVSKDNFNEFESTEWSVVFDQSSGEAVYYHRENYKKGCNYSEPSCRIAKNSYTALKQAVFMNGKVKSMRQKRMVVSFSPVKYLDYVLSL